MGTRCQALFALLLTVLLLAPAAPGPAEAATVRHAGVVVSVDKAAGAFTVGDMGPKLPSGESVMRHYTIRVTPSTELLSVKRSAGVGPRGFPGDYVETRLSSLDIKPGDWVTTSAEAGKKGLTATQVVVVSTAEP